MSFEDRLPRGANEDWRYDVVAPSNGLGAAMAEVLRRLTDREMGHKPDEELIHLDLNLMHDWHRFQLRLIPTRDDFTEDDRQPGVFHIGGALGVLLDADGRETGRNFIVLGWLETITATYGTVAGKLSLKRWSPDLRSEAS